MTIVKAHASLVSAIKELFKLTEIVHSKIMLTACSIDAVRVKTCLQCVKIHAILVENKSEKGAKTKKNR